jgi:hypothetical protein
MIRPWFLTGALCALVVLASGADTQARQQTARPWLQSFPVKPGDLATVGENA